MPVQYVDGDPLLTKAQTLAVGHNAKGRTQLGALETRLLDLHPAAFATYGKLCRGGKIKPGMFWMWRESQPNLMLMAVRESAVGATRLRFVESIMMTIARDYGLHGLTSIAIAPLSGAEEWDSLKPAVDYWLRLCPLEVTVYERYIPGLAAENEEAG
jgi:hypothetical protein